MVTQIAAILPTSSPPYENPIDLRIPLHFDTSTGTIENLWSPQKRNKDSMYHAYIALSDHIYDICKKGNPATLGVHKGVGVSPTTTTRQGETSPIYFQVMLNRVDRENATAVYEALMPLVVVVWGPNWDDEGFDL